MALEGWGTQVRVEEGKDLNQRKKRHRMNMKSLLYRVYVLSLTLVLLPPRASLVAQRIKRLPAVRETQVQSLGWEDPLEKEMSTHSSILARRILWTENPMDREAWWATVHRVAKSRTRLSNFTFFLSLQPWTSHLLPLPNPQLLRVYYI